ATWRNPDGEVFSVSHIDSKSARSRVCSSEVIGPLLSGVHQLGLRWYTASDPTSFAIDWISWTPLDPVPTTATRLPAKSTGVVGHRPVWYCSPRKSSRSGTSGMNGIESTPVAATRNRARTSGPSLTATDHVPDASS